MIVEIGKFTKIEKFDALIGILCGEDVQMDRQLLVDFCQDEIDMLVAKSEKLKAERAIKRAEPDPLLDLVYDELTDKYQSADDIVEILGDPEITAGKVRNRLSTLVREGRAKKQQMMIPAGDGTKARPIMCYIKQ